MNKSSKGIIVVLMTSLLGSILEIWGGSWDITSHLLGAPETFFTPPHTVLYSGVGISLIAAIIAGVVLLKNKEVRSTSIAFGLKLIIIGSIIQIFAGPSDYAWHEMFGVDGLLSPTHLTLITGILIQSVGIVLGLTRLIPYNFKIVKPATVISFSGLWFIIIAFAFQFGLPISEGETMDLNPDPYVGGIILGLTIPFFTTLVFWGGAKSMKKFGWASGVVGVLLFFNITANVIPAEDLWVYLPWFGIAMITAIIADAVITGKIKISKFGEEIAGGIVGATTLVCSMPLVGMAYIQFYIFNDVSGYYLLPEFSETLGMALVIMSIPSAIMGIIAVRIAKKKITIPVESTV